MLGTTRCPRRRRSPRWAPTFALVTFALVTASAAPAVAAVRPQQQTTTTSPAQRLPELVAGATVTGGVVHTPGAPDRRFDADKATAFMQAWFFDSVLEKLPQSRPPAGIPISRLSLTTRWHTQDYPMTVLYTCQDHTAWVGMPPQGFGWAGVESERWIEAPQSDRLIAAFNGKLQATRDNKPVQVPPAEARCTVAQPTNAKPSGSSGSSGSAWPWILGGVAIVGIGGGTLLLARRRANSQTAPPS
jgi:hypothetical protein